MSSLNAATPLEQAVAGTPSPRLPVFSGLLMVLLLGACASRPVTVVARFDEVQATRLMQPGGNTIVGSALLRQRGGGVVTCAGREVHLIPLTEYAKEWAGYEFEWATVQTGVRPADWRANSYLHQAGFIEQRRSANCDAQGAFRFENVADGQFYLTTDVSWIAGNAMQGGQLVRLIELSGSKRHDITLSL